MKRGLRQAALSVHVPVFRAAKEGHSVASPVLLGTADARANLSLDITTATSRPRAALMPWRSWPRPG